MQRIKRLIPVLWIVLLFGVLLFNLSLPWMRQFLLQVFTSLYKYPRVFAEAALVTFFADVGMVLLVKRRPRPYAWSLMTLGRYLAKALRALRAGRSVRNVHLTPEEEFSKSHFNFAPMEVRWLWVPFLVLLTLNIPVLAAFEELVFRNGRTWFPTIVLWSVMFALVHVVAGYRVVSLPMVMLIGIWLGAHYVSGGLTEAIIYHVAMNLIGMVVMLFDMKVWPDIKPYVEHRRWFIRLREVMA